jgi:hypothetical protein
MQRDQDSWLAHKVLHNQFGSKALDSSIPPTDKLSIFGLTTQQIERLLQTHQLVHGMRT